MIASGAMRRVLGAATLVLALGADMQTAHAAMRMLIAGPNRLQSTVRDSAGIRIVDNVRPAWAPGQEWRVTGTPSVIIGDSGREEHEALSSVSGAVRLADGSIVVGDGGALRVRLYGEDGRHVRSFGGPGEGPGEFGVLGLIGRVDGDSIGVWDPRRKRMTLFSRAGHPRTGPVVAVPGTLVPAIAWLENGSVLVTSTITVEEALATPAGERRAQVTYMMVAPDAGTRTVVVLPGQEVLVRRTSRSYVPEPVLFGRTSHVAARAGEVVHGDSDVFELRRRGRDGRLSMIIRRSGSARPVTAEELASARAEAEERRQRRLGLAARIAGGPVPVSSGAAELPHRRTHPHFDDLRLDDSGHIWARESSLGAVTRSWIVFDPTGTWLGSVHVPARLRITDIGADYILGIYRDELEIETVRLYRLDRRN